MEGQSIEEEFKDADSVPCVLDPQELDASPTTTIARSKSTNFTRRKRIDWLRRSLPPLSRKQRSINPSDAVSKENKHACEVPIPRSKSTIGNFKSARENGVYRAARSLHLSTGGRVGRPPTLTPSSDVSDTGFVRRILSRPSVISLFPVVQKIQETRSRKWTVAIFSLVAALLASLRGFTLAFSSNATLDLMGEADELPQTYLFSTFLISVFAVNIIVV